MYVYRNQNTQQEVSYPQRRPRLDRLPNWTLIRQPAEAPPEPPAEAPPKSPRGRKTSGQTPATPAREGA